LDLRRGKWQEAGEDCIMRSFINFTLHQILLGDRIKEDEIGGACSTHMRGDVPVVFWLEALKGRNHSEDIVIDGRIIL
jgi:hypothetical protein